MTNKKPSRKTGAGRSRSTRRHEAATPQAPVQEPSENFLPTHVLVYGNMDYFPAGTIEEIRALYARRVKDLEDSPEKLAAFRDSVSLFQLNRQPDFQLMAASLTDKVADALNRGVDLLSENLKDPATLERAIKEKTDAAARMAKDSLGNAAQTLRGAANGKFSSLLSIGKAGLNLAGTVHEKLSNAVASAKTVFNQVREEFRPQTAEGLLSMDGKCLVSAAWLIAPGNAMKIEDHFQILETPAARRSAKLRKSGPDKNPS